MNDQNSLSDPHSPQGEACQGTRRGSYGDWLEATDLLLTHANAIEAGRGPRRADLTFRQDLTHDRSDPSQ